jgi:hypothetical protein
MRYATGGAVITSDLPVITYISSTPLPFTPSSMLLAGGSVFEEKIGHPIDAVAANLAVLCEAVRGLERELEATR